MQLNLGQILNRLRLPLRFFDMLHLRTSRLWPGVVAVS